MIKAAGLQCKPALIYSFMDNDGAQFESHLLGQFHIALLCDIDPPDVSAWHGHHLKLSVEHSPQLVTSYHTPKGV